MLSYMHPQSDAVPWTEIDPSVAADDNDTTTITQRQALHQQPPVSFPPWQPSSWELCPPLPTAAMSMALAITLTHQHIHDMHYLTPRSRYDELKNYIQQRFHLEQDNPFYIHFKVSQPHPRSPLKYYISSQHDLDQYVRLLYKQHLHIQRHQVLPPTSPTSPNTSSNSTSSTITSTTTTPSVTMITTTTSTTTTSSSQSHSNSLFASAYAHATSTEPQASTSTQIHAHTHIPTQTHTHIPIMTSQPSETESDSDALWYDTNLATLYITVHSDATSIIPDIHTISQTRSLATAQATAKAEQQLLKLLSTIVAPLPDSPDEQEPISWQLVSTSSSTVSTPSSAGASPTSPNSNTSSNSSTISVSIPDTLMTSLHPVPSIPLTQAIEQAEEIRKREKFEIEKRRLQAQIEAQKLVLHPESASAEPIAEEFFTILNRMAPTQPSGPYPPIKIDASSRRDEMKTYQSMLQQLEKLNQTCPTSNTQPTIRDTRMRDEDEDEDDEDDEHDTRMEKRRKRHRETDGQRYHKLTALFEQLHQLTKSYAMSQQTSEDCKETSQARRSSKPTSLIGKGNLLHEATRMITELEQQRAELEHKLRMKEVQAKHLYRKEVNQHMYAIGLAISLQSSQDSSIYHAIMSAGVITSKYDRNGAMLESSFATINTLGFRPEQVMHRVITDSPMFEQAAPIPFDFLHRRQTTRELAREYLPNWSPAQYYRGNSQIEEEGYGDMEYQPQPLPQSLPIPWWKQWKTLKQPTPFIIRRKTGRPREYVEIVSLRQVVCDSNGEPQFFLSMSNRRFGIYVSQDELSTG